MEQTINAPVGATEQVAVEQVQHPARFLKQRKFMVVLPLLVLPFLTMAFWAMGGGKGDAKPVAQQQVGLNLQLPDASLKDDKNADKLSFYKDADAGAAKRLEAMRNDPNYKGDSAFNALQQPYNQTAFSGINTTPLGSSSVEANTQKVYQKIEELNRQINQPETTTTSYNEQIENYQQNGNPEQFTKEVDRLQGMMQTMTTKQEKDPEMEQLNGTLDKILDIQNPERMRDKIKKQSLQEKSKVFTVGTDNGIILDTYFGNSNDTIKQPQKNGFFDDGNSPLPSSQVTNAIAAVVQETQTVTAGATVKMRLVTDVFINGIHVPIGSFVYGTASLDNERLLINIPNIRVNNNLLPVALSVYDMDGLTGIYVPGSINRDVAKQAADQNLQSFGLTTLDPSLAAQAASAGIQTAKTLIGKKVKLEKVTVKAGYKVLLKDNNQQN